jgi:hypothetical protein
MSMRAWQDRIVGDRMTVDQEFTERVESSQFSRQQWGLIMTAVEFEIHHSADAARLVANTEKLPHVMGELDDIDARTNPMGGSDDSGGGGVIDSLRGLFGGGGGDGAGEQLAAAERLAEEYAERLQTHLEKQEKWDEIRAAARD